MRRKTHGALSLGLVAIAMAAAAQSLFQQSLSAGMAYMFLAGLSVPVILYAFCAKCADRENCGHVVPGPAAAKAFKNRESGPYTPRDLFLTFAALAVLFLFPQIWLWRHPLAFGTFWILMAVAAVDIRAGVCGDCGNAFCPGNSRNARKLKLNR
jgi:hypothetical protein